MCFAHTHIVWNFKCIVLNEINSAKPTYSSPLHFLFITGFLFKELFIISLEYLYKSYFSTFVVLDYKKKKIQFSLFNAIYIVIARFYLTRNGFTQSKEGHCMAN